MSLGNLITDIGAAAGDKGKNSIERLTKNSALEKFNIGSQTDYGKTLDASKLGLDDYIRMYTAGNPAATAAANQEAAGLGRYWSLNGAGLLPEQQDWLGQYGNAARTATSLGNAYALRNMNLSRVGGAGGGDSWTTRALAGDAGARENQNLLGLLSAQQAMRDRNEQIRLGTIGQRTAIANADAARLLVPGQARQGLQDWSTGAISRLLANDAANNMYGVKYNPSGSEMAGNIVGDVYSGYGGGGNRTPTGTNWAAGSPYINPNAVQPPSQYSFPGGPGYVTPLPYGAPAVPWGQMPLAAAAPAATGWNSPAMTAAFNW